jgi:hypothetical protein
VFVNVARLFFSFPLLRGKISLSVCAWQVFQSHIICLNNTVNLTERVLHFNPVYGTGYDLTHKCYICLKKTLAYFVPPSVTKKKSFMTLSKVNWMISISRWRECCHQIKIFSFFKYFVFRQIGNNWRAAMAESIQHLNWCWSCYLTKKLSLKRKTQYGWLPSENQCL